MADLFADFKEGPQSSGLVGAASAPAGENNSEIVCGIQPNSELFAGKARAGQAVFDFVQSRLAVSITVRAAGHNILLSTFGVTEFAAFIFGADFKSAVIFFESALDFASRGFLVSFFVGGFQSCLGFGRGGFCFSRCVRFFVFAGATDSKSESDERDNEQGSHVLFLRVENFQTQVLHRDLSLSKAGPVALRDSHPKSRVLEVWKNRLRRVR